MKCLKNMNDRRGAEIGSDHYVVYKEKPEELNVTKNSDKGE